MKKMVRELIGRDSTTDPREHSDRVGTIVLGFYSLGKNGRPVGHYLGGLNFRRALSTYCLFQPRPAGVRPGRLGLTIGPV
jgi:hypothetical protein